MYLSIESDWLNIDINFDIVVVGIRHRAFIFAYDFLIHYVERTLHFFPGTTKSNTQL